MSNVEILTKLSVKKVLGKIENVTEKKILMQVFGVATGVKTGDSNYGPWEALTGQFRAINLETGQIYQSGICFLPQVALNLITHRVKEDSVNGVEFAFNIGVVPADNKAGYEYSCEPLIEASENDPLEVLQKKMSNLLPSPDKGKGKTKAA